MPETDPSPDPKKKVTGVIFLTLFIDLVGFSIIFPLFPAMLDYYLAREDSGLIALLIRSIENLSGQPDNRFLTTVLFGGILGSLYSLLQFIAAPLWGILSDRIGRRKVLLLTVAGTALSYFLWVFSASFEGLIAARLLGGLMAGNISVATAAIADTTIRKQRGAGMAIVGVAFGLGFVLGPAIGGLSVAWQPGAPVGLDQAWGWHPFSGPALIAAVLACLNWFWVVARFPETAPFRMEDTEPEKTDPLTQLKGLRLDVPAIRQTIWIYFTMLFAFSGMEFTLTFLAVERFQYSPAQNGLMFVFIGITLALVQGGITRRLAPRVGEKRLASTGLVLGVVAFLFLAWSGDSQLLFYIGLGFMAASIGLASPTLQALVSLYADRQNQGKFLGYQRSAGSFARAIGPFVAAALFFGLGSNLSYTLGAIFMAIPLLLIFRLTPPASN